MFPSESSLKPCHWSVLIFSGRCLIRNRSLPRAETDLVAILVATVRAAADEVTDCGSVYTQQHGICGVQEPGCGLRSDNTLRRPAGDVLLADFRRRSRIQNPLSQGRFQGLMVRAAYEWTQSQRSHALFT
ncbi:hypothetical protein NDU88_002875 [Pleurodeles waltl]|uniref:Uncharacterized protein n=1 Tax=Pleurodeles waltl TaxID=8319 RepID=A0AAV7SDY4_PLEWA|nr:hypothetical protein NDU88_002875 [Pleurodeles waltl]